MVEGGNRGCPVTVVSRLGARCYTKDLVEGLISEHSRMFAEDLRSAWRHRVLHSERRLPNISLIKGY